jgi:hypothetical protein
VSHSSRSAQPWESNLWTLHISSNQRRYFPCRPSIFQQVPPKHRTKRYRLWLWLRYSQHVAVAQPLRDQTLAEGLAPTVRSPSGLV